MGLNVQRRRELYQIGVGQRTLLVFGMKEVTTAVHFISAENKEAWLVAVARDKFLITVVAQTLVPLCLQLSWREAFDGKRR